MWCLSKLFKLLKGPLLCFFQVHVFYLNVYQKLFTLITLNKHIIFLTLSTLLQLLYQANRAVTTLDPQSPVCLSSVSGLYCAQAWYTFLVLPWFEEVCFGRVRLLMHEHKNGFTKWTWSKIMCIMPSCIMKNPEMWEDVYDQNNIK